MKVGVIGVGAMGRNHARIYSELADLVSIADVDRAKGREIANRYNARWYKDYKDLLKSDVEAVSVATPTNTHYEIAKDAISTGKHVLVEKPICSNIAEAEKLIQHAKNQGVVLAVGHVERHNPVVRFAKEAVNENRFGDLITISARRVSYFPSRIKDVGVTLDMGIHDIDVMRYVVGGEIESVYTLGGKRGDTRFESYANILLKFKNDISGFIEVNWLTPMKVRKLALTCSKNFVELDYIDQLVKISSSKLVRYDESDLFKTSYEFDRREVSLKKEEPLMNEIADFLSAIEKKKNPLVPGEEGFKSLKVALAATKSYKNRKEIILEDFDV